MLAVKYVNEIKEFFRHLKKDDEFEIRFGQFIQNIHFQEGMTEEEFPAKQKFIPNIDVEHFDKIYTKTDLFSNKKPIEEISAVWTSGGQMRTIYILDPNKLTAISKSIEFKDRINTLNIPELSCRISVMNEKKIENIKLDRVNIIRFRDRISKFSKDSLWKYEFTKIISRHVDTDDDATVVWKDIIEQSKKKNYDNYELEIEFIDEVKDIDFIITSLQNQIASVLKEIDKGYILKIKKEEIYKDIKNLLSNRYTFIKNSVNLDFNRNLVSKVLTLKRSNLGEIETKRYAVTEKADGLRMLLFQGNENVYLINSNNEIRDILTEKGFKLKCKTDNSSLIDGEFVDKIGFMAFDILIYKSEDVTHLNLIERHKLLDEFVKSCKSKKIQMKKFYITIDDNTSAKLKTQKESGIYDLTRQVLSTKYPYEIDGVIFTPIDATYWNKETYKWKPPEQTTIDFLARLHKSDSEIMTFYLFVGINTSEDRKKTKVISNDEYRKLFPKIKKNTNYYPTLFDPSFIWKIETERAKKFNIRDNIVVELFWNGEEWDFLRIREDKTSGYLKFNNNFGNNWKVAIDNWDTIIKPITENMITGKETVPFFVDKAEKKTNIKAMRRFHNYIKNYSYETYANDVDWLLEIAGGRLGDLHKWINAKIKNVVVTDIDREALQIGRERYDSLTKKPKTKVFEIIADAKENIQEILKSEKLAKSFDVIACQFAIHFFFENEKILDKFISNVDDNLKKGGYFIASALDGKQVFDLIEKNRMSTGQTLDLNTNNGQTVFSFKKLFTGRKFLSLEGEIAVFVESIGGLRNEYLVDFTLLKNKFRKKGYKVIECTPFEKFYKDFSEINELSDVEKIYSFMGILIIFQKNK